MTTIVSILTLFSWRGSVMKETIKLPFFWCWLRNKLVWTRGRPVCPSTSSINNAGRNIPSVVLQCCSLRSNYPGLACSILTFPVLRGQSINHMRSHLLFEKSHKPNENKWSCRTWSTTIVCVHSIRWSKWSRIRKKFEHSKWFISVSESQCTDHDANVGRESSKLITWYHASNWFKTTRKMWTMANGRRFPRIYFRHWRRLVYNN